MLSYESYKTVEKEANDELTEKRSRFIGYCKPVKNEEEAIQYINSIKSKHWDARHNVYAYCIQEGQIKRYSDDGEPQGTAGVPVLEVLTKNQITDVVVVVTRYFGGILLGTRGLVRAYSASAKKAVEAANIINMVRCSVCTLVCDYNRYGKVSSLIPQSGGIIDESSFGSEVSITFHIESGSLESFNKRLADATCGELCTRVEYEDYFSM